MKEDSNTMNHWGKQKRKKDVVWPGELTVKGERDKLKKTIQGKKRHKRPRGTKNI